MNRDDRMLAALVGDRIDQCGRRYMVTNTEFLDMRQRSEVQHMLENTLSGKYEPVKFGFYGGFEDAERVIAVFMPEHITYDDPESYFSAEPDENPLTVLRLSLKRGSSKPGHRDYLGALMGLGIKREVTGDILVRDDGADIILMKSISEYVASNLSRAGNAAVFTEETSVSELRIPKISKKELTDTVASLRLDAVIAAVFGLPRGRALEAVKSGIVFINNEECTKPDRPVSEGDRITLRGKGRAVLKSAGGAGRKGRMRITMEVYT